MSRRSIPCVWERTYPFFINRGSRGLVDHQHANVPDVAKRPTSLMQQRSQVAKGKSHLFLEAMR
ncbi:hypothetical protein AWV79_26785 [Cupriavidus sp. UYMMa02A]|nr:hypothetical protein AWV79_26785 [Cupriavidus sp. UYMMa02A]